MKPLYLIFLTIPLFLFASSSCKKSAKNKAPYGSPYTYLMCGTHNFYHITSGTTYMTHQPYSDTDTVAFAINFIDSASVSFRSLTFRYDSTSTGSVLTYNYSNPGGHPQRGYLRFDHIANVIYVYYQDFISAGGGIVDETFSSF